MYLFINNLDQNKIFLGLIRDKSLKGLIQLSLVKKQNHSENLLKGVHKILTKANKTVKYLKGIIVVNGPGSFVGIRIALSVANTLAWTEKIPVVGVSLFEGADNKELIKKGLIKLSKAKKSEYVKPFYGKEPNITKPKSK